MTRQTDLGALVKKYDETISDLEMQIEEVKRKKNVVLQAIELLEKEGVFEQDKLFPIPTTPIRISEKYSVVSMSEAIYDMLNNTPGLDAEEVHAELMRHGFKSDSQSLKRDVYTRLYRLAKEHKLISFKRDGKKKYKLPKKEGESKAQNE